MFVVKLYHYIRGYVKFEVSGGFVERFINLVSQREISMWNTYKSGECLYGYTLLSDYKKMQELSEKIDVSLKIVEEKGVPKKSKPYHKRWGFAVGVITVFLMLHFSSKIIFTIDVSGNKTVDDEIILNVLEDNGFKVGCVANKLDLEMIREKTLLEVPELSWLAINIQGVNAVIDVKERVEMPDITDHEGKANLISNKNAIISEMRVYGGKSLVQVGDVVTEGQMLVSGSGESRDGTIIEQKAYGEVLAKVFDEKTFEVDYMGTEKKELEPKNNYIFKVLGFKIPITRIRNISETSIVEVNEEPLSIFGVKIPIKKYTQQITEVEYYETVRNEEEVRKCLEEEMKAYEDDFSEESIVLEKEIEEILGEDGISYNVKYIFEENIAVSQIIN